VADQPCRRGGAATTALFREAAAHRSLELPALPRRSSSRRSTHILSGTLLVGYGEKFDESEMKALPAGSMFTEPAKQSHFVWAKDSEVVIQVVGHGRSATTPVATGR